MLCLRRALREFPESIEARVHLGEVLWQLERRADAIAAWRDVATAAARDHGSPRVQAAAAIASLWDGDDDPAQAQIIAAAIAADPQVVCAASLGDALGALLDERRPERAFGIVVEALGSLQLDAASAQAMPAVLIALALEQIAKSDRSGASAEWRNAVAARRWSPSEHDALRRAALAMFAAAPDDASALAQRYADLCARHERGSAPVAWPARTRGDRLRIALVCAKRSPDDARRSIEALPADRFAVNIIDVTQPLHARDIAALDADILVDLVGLEVPVERSNAR